MPSVAQSLFGRLQGQALQSGLGVVRIPIGATGAVGSVTQGAGAQIAVARSGTGAYNVTLLPFGTRQAVSITVVSPLGTVRYAYLTAQSSTAGTCSFTTAAAGGSATDPASGDVLVLQYQVDA